jgi:MFS family permease
MLGAWLVTLFGGVNAGGIRPLFFVSALITAFTFVVIWTQLSAKQEKSRSKSRPHIFHDLQQVLKEGRHLNRWLIISAVNSVPLAMVFPFSQVFAHEIKGADPFILGSMVTGSALTSIVFAIPLGHGRVEERDPRRTMPFLDLQLDAGAATTPAFRKPQGFTGFITSAHPLRRRWKGAAPGTMGRGGNRPIFSDVSNALPPSFRHCPGSNRPQYAFLGFIALIRFASPALDPCPKPPPPNWQTNLNFQELNVS